MVKRKVPGISIPKITRGLPVGTLLNASDNSGAKILQIISVKGHRTRLRRNPAAHVGDLVVCSVKKGTPKMRRQIVHAIIIRQRKKYRRFDGTWISFYDNAAVVTSDTGELKGSEIRGSVAKETAEKYPRLASAATMII
ncbi:MAG: 50S ribosomal protein L14 [Candidatus Hodarchaeales archaeon]|jgi:large subunit ribosomal protein L14